MFAWPIKIYKKKKYSLVLFCFYKNIKLSQCTIFQIRVAIFSIFDPKFSLVFMQVYFTNPNIMNQSDVERDKPYACDSCDKRFYHNSHLRRHQTRTHGRLPTRVRINSKVDRTEFESKKDNPVNWTT